MARRVALVRHSSSSHISSVPTVSGSVSRDEDHQSVLNRERNDINVNDSFANYCLEHDRNWPKFKEKKIMDLHSRILTLSDSSMLSPEKMFIERYYQEGTDQHQTVPVSYIKFLDDTWTYVSCQLLLKTHPLILETQGSQNLEKIRHTLRVIRQNAKLELVKQNNLILRNDVLIDLSIRYLSSRQYLRAAVSCFAAVRILAISGAEDAASGISTCVYRMFQIAKNMKVALPEETFHELITNIFSLVWESVSYFACLECCKKDDTEFEHGVSLYYVAMMYNICEQYEEDAAINERAIKKLRESRQSSCIYACCHNNAGVAHMKLKNYERAKNFYESAIASYEAVSNWTCARKKQMSIDTTRRNLQRVENLLKERERIQKV